MKNHKLTKSQEKRLYEAYGLIGQKTILKDTEHSSKVLGEILDVRPNLKEEDGKATFSISYLVKFDSMHKPILSKKFWKE